MSSNLRPYSTFGLAPFLWIDETDWPQIQKIHRALSLKHHPDRVDPNDTKAQAEAESFSAQLNTDLAQLRDLYARLEHAISEIPKSANRPLPEFAAEYFELQELASEEGPTSKRYLDQCAAFVSRLTRELSDAETQLESLAKKYPYPAPAPVGFVGSDLQAIDQQLAKRRYLRRVLADLIPPA